MTVWFRSQPVGSLEPDQRGGFLFSYNDEWENEENSFPVSISIPLGEPVDQRRVDAFFSNLLPEGSGKERLCRQLGISTENRYEILKAIGKDCAGASGRCCASAGDHFIQQISAGRRGRGRSGD